MSDSNDCTTNNEQGQESQNVITELLRNEVQKCIENLDAKISTYAKREELQDVIKKCIQEKLPPCLCQLTKNAFPNQFPMSENEELEFTVEFRDDSSNSRQLRLSEIFTLMERRITFLESRIAVLLHMKGFRNISEKFKIEGKASEQERSIEQRMASGESGNSFVEEIVKKPVATTQLETNPYDDLYYEWRQKKMNQLFNKNSEGDLRLKRIPEIDGHLRPSINRDCFVQFIKSQDVLD